MKLLIMQFPPISRHMIPLRSKYSPQDPVSEAVIVCSLTSYVTCISEDGQTNQTVGLQAEISLQLPLIL
jgi:hypothetical protein